VRSRGPAGSVRPLAGAGPQSWTKRWTEEIKVSDRLSRLVISLRHLLAPAALILGSLAASGIAQAADPLGLYIGAAYGQAHLRARFDDLDPGSPQFDATHSAYQAMVGIRPLSFLGAEVDYMDLGRQSLGFPSPTSTEQQLSQRGEAAYALLYLPVPVIDVYVKAGISRITSDRQVVYDLPGAGTCVIGISNCNFFSAGGNSTDTSFAYGAGLQWKLGSWAVRGEYERFSAAGANPTLFSVGMTYWVPWG
jgi:opacity protein-like surface antigen